MRKILMVGAFALVATCSAEDVSKQGQLLYGAGEYSEAIRCFEQLVKSGLPSKERDIARYNLATSYLANNEWKEALRELGQIDLGENPQPLLAFRLHANQAVAYWRGAELTVISVEETDEAALGRCDEAISLLEKAWREWNSATTAACALAEIEGNPGAPLPKELGEMREGIKERQAHLKRLRERLYIGGIPYGDLLSTIRQGLGVSVLVLDQVGAGEVAQEARAAYLLQLGLKGRHLLSLWEGLERRMEERIEVAHRSAEERRGAPFENEEERLGDPEVAEAIQSQRLLMMADGLFRRSLQCLKCSDVWEARASQAEASLGLEILEAVHHGKDPLHLLLLERNAIAQRLADEEREPLHRALQREREDAEQFWLALAHGISTDLPDLECALMERLIERVGNPGATLSQIEYDPFFYAQIATPEENTLLLLREEARQRKGSHHLPRLQALRERFEVRARCEEGERCDRIVEILRAAERAVTPTLCWDELRGRVEEALRCWDPVSWLGFKVKELREGAGSLPTARLSSECDPLIKVAREEELEQAASGLSATRKDIDEGTIQLSHDHPGCAAVCMLDAMRWLARTSQCLDEQGGESPEDPLAQAIEEQRHALALNVKSQEAGRSETLFPSVISITGGAQKLVVSIAEQIPNEAFAESPDQLSLFQRGLGAAKRAQEGLDVRWPDWLEIQEEQQRAIDLWTQAQSQGDGQGGSNSQEGDGEGSGNGSPSEGQKEQGDQPSEEGGEGEAESASTPYFSDCPQEFPPESRENMQPPRAESGASEETSPAQVFEWLQQMDQEDRPPSRTEGVVRQGVCPW